MCICLFPVSMHEFPLLIKARAPSTMVLDVILLQLSFLCISPIFFCALDHSHVYINIVESYLPSQQTPSPPSMFPSTYKCIFLLPSQQNSLKDSIITVSSHSTSAILTSLPLSCNYFCQGHQWPPSCNIQWSILCLHLDVLTAFDIVDYYLLEIFSTLGFQAITISWFYSCLTGYSWSINIHWINEY